MAEKQIETVGELQDEMSQILVNGPLYRRFIYKGTNCHQSFTSGKRYGSLPKRLRIFCENKHCKQETWWDTDGTIIHFDSSFINKVEYTCRNCGEDRCYYYFIWQEQEQGNIFVKVGQYPELEERVSETLSESLGPADLKLFKNALRMRNFNLGLAAVAYMRRVVENRMNDMLDILREAAAAHNDVTPELQAAFDAIKAEKRFVAKVEFAGKLLPSSLRPPGKPNPMGVLHDLASDGIHAKSDEECVQIFDSCRKTFEYVFGNLRIETEHAKDFVSEMAALAETRAKTATENQSAVSPTREKS
jgi:hypothetical protein